jgi:predicted ArsR family transcriptional regulator
MGQDIWDQHLSGISGLDHPISRRAYRLVVDRGWISRDAAADELDVARSVARFHLDKLVDLGLLQTRYERLSGRTGPGAGRPAKLYGRSDTEIDLSIPPRRYDLAGSLLAEAVSVSAADGTPVRDALADVAHARGKRVGDEVPRQPSGSTTEPLMDVLARHGYEPQERDGEIALRNCPFHTLAAQQRDLVCHMNLDYLGGVLEGVEGANGCCARLAPEEGYCCVRLWCAPAGDARKRDASD